MAPDAIRALLAEIGRQLAVRERPYREAGGDVRKMRGDLTCYLPLNLVRDALAADVPDVSDALRWAARTDDGRQIAVGDSFGDVCAQADALGVTDPIIATVEGEDVDEADR
jgi:hypothetical protein